MCVAIPGQVQSVGAQTAGSRPALIDIPGRGVVPIDLIMVPEAGIDDYVIVHSGYAISRVTRGEAEATFDLLSGSGNDHIPTTGPETA